MTKCHYTDHHHIWYFNNTLALVCEYCEASVEKDAYNLHYIMRDTFGIDSTGGKNINQAIGDYLWEEQQRCSQKGHIQPAAAMSTPATHMALSDSKEVSWQQQLVGCPIESPVTTPNVETTQSPDCTQSPPRRPADYYSDLQKEVAQALVTLVGEPFDKYLEGLGRLELETREFLAEWLGSFESFASLQNWLGSSPTQSSNAPSDPDKP